MLPFGFYNINIKLSLGDNKRCLSKNSAVVFTFLCWQIDIAITKIKNN